MRSFENQNYDVDVVSRSPLMLRVPVFCGVNFVSSSRISLSLSVRTSRSISFEDVRPLVLEVKVSLRKFVPVFERASLSFRHVIEFVFER